MLKGHVFSKQLFGNPIFALFINTFLNGTDGVSNNFKNGMQITYSGSNVTVDSGAVCIQGRFLEEDSSTTISAGTDNMYCKLVIEIDLDKENTDSSFLQGAYKIVKSASSYPNLTQTNIVKNVSGLYQYELARFKTSLSGITNFQDMRTFLDFDSIYEQITAEYEDILGELQEELANVEDGSAYVLKNDYAVITGSLLLGANARGSKYENLPSGFTRDNCVVVSLGATFNESGLGYQYGTNTTNGNASNAIQSTNVGIGLGGDYTNKIGINAYNSSNQSRTLLYKIVLMKV